MTAVGWDTLGRPDGQGGYWHDRAIDAERQLSGRTTETIVAAAIRYDTPAEYALMSGYPDHMIVSAPAPARHHSLLHPMFTLTGKRAGPHNQGFLTSTGRYVDREEAHAIAVASGQPMIDHPSRVSGVLFSEDLW
jgi:hypothetical protein